jgi:glycosyltransferase involved in cell wall biosynthesis
MIDPNKPNLGGAPLAPWRPRLKYLPIDRDLAPVVTVVTVVDRATPLLLDTLASLCGQSLQAWRWIVVDDGTRDRETAAFLDLAERRDPRVERRTLAIGRGLARARNFGVLASRTPFVHLLEAGDLLEATALEKCLWALHSHVEWAFVRTHSVELGDMPSLHTAGETEDACLARPPIPGGALFRRDAFLHAGGFDGLLGDDALEWWELWLRCAARGLARGTIAEVLSWWRPRQPTPAARLEEFRATLPRRHAGLVAFGSTAPSPYVPSQPAAEPCETRNPLVHHAKRLLAIVPALTLNGVGALLLEMLPILQKRGWQTTIAATRAPVADAAPAFGRLSVDVHVLDSFLRPVDQPRFLRELMESRRPAWVLVAPGRFGAAVTAHLRSCAPTQRFAELRHFDPSDADLDRLGHAEPCDDDGAPDLRLCTNGSEVAALGTSAVHIPLAVDTTVWRRRAPPRQWMRPQWDASPDDTVLVFAGRLGHHFRTDVAAATLAELRRRRAPVRLVVAASGPETNSLRTAFARLDCADHALLVGAQPTETWLKMFSAADVFFAPVHDGTLLAVVRAMACGLPVATSTSGAHASLVDQSCGITVPPSDVDTQARAYADAIEAWAGNPGLRRQLGRAARDRVIAHHAPDALALPLLSHLTASEERGARVRASDPRTQAIAARIFELGHARATCETIREANEELAAQCAAFADRARTDAATRDWLTSRLRAAEEELAARASQLEAQQQRIERLVESLAWSEERLRDGRHAPPEPTGDRP